ncbi:MAG: lysophospholipid acyltransferase family protein [Planctomycetia bacterium]|nr:lysophospholipid acyltransferase family protein [Planctomycetia bacterium]
MKFRSPLLINLAGISLTAVIRTWMRSLDYKVVFYDPAVDPCHPDCREYGLYVFWHENILIPLFMRGRCNLAMLMSRHRDADLLTRLSLHFGFQFVRGSTARGGEKALRELVRLSHTTHLTITPDGPRGPRRRMAAGPIYLASRTGLPLVLMGLGYDRPWRMPTWDQFAVPRPGSRARVVMSPPIRLPANLDRDGVEHYRQQMETLLNRLSDEAEAWAVAGTSKQGELTPQPGPPTEDATLSALEAWWQGEQSPPQLALPRTWRQAA